MRENDKELLQQMRALGAMQPSTDATVHAVERLRQRLLEVEKLERKALQRKWMMRISIPSGIAAVILLGMGLLWFGHGTRQVSAAERLQEVITATEGYKGWIHIVSTTRGNAIKSGVSVKTQTPQRFERHFNTEDGTNVWVKFEGGGEHRTIRWWAPKSDETWEYHGKEGVLFVSNIRDKQQIDVFNASAAHVSVTPSQLLQEIVKNTGYAPVEIKQEQEGKLERWEVCFYKDEAEAKRISERDHTHLPPNAKWWVDPVSKRIMREQILNTTDTVDIEYGYGSPEFQSIYGMAIPKDVRVLDDRQSPLTKQVLDRIESRVAKGFGNGVAMVTTSDVDDEGKIVTNGFGFLSLYAVEGEKSLRFGYRLAPSANARFIPAEYVFSHLPEAWPRPNVGALLEQVTNAPPTEFVMILPDHIWMGDYSGSRQPPLRMDSLGTDEIQRQILKARSLAGERFWPQLNKQSLSAINVHTEAKLDPQRVGLLKIETENRGGDLNLLHMMFPRSGSTVWLDPARDDVPVEIISKTYRLDQTEVANETHTNYLEYAQLPGGQWYPTRWRETRVFYPVGKPMESNVSEYNLQIVPGMKLDAAWFVSPAERFKATGH